MTPICLVTGFLGSGKTTLLKGIVERYREQRIAYVVNEFSGFDVDGALLGDGARGVVPLPGGSVFCNCLVGEFIRMLKELPERSLPGVEQLDGVVIEASGIANPMVVEKMLAETQLDQQYSLASIITLVDPGTFPTLVHTLPNVKAQVLASDLVVLNKTDAYPEAALAACEEAVRKIRPGAALVRTQYAEVDFPLFEARTDARGLEGEYAACIDPNFAKVLLPLRENTDMDKLMAALDGFGDALYRAKGFLRVDGAAHYLDWTAHHHALRPWAGHIDAMGLAVIVRGGENTRAKALAAAAERGEFDAP